jgi:DNA replication protein DnaC
MISYEERAKEHMRMRKTKNTIYTYVKRAKEHMRRTRKKKKNTMNEARLPNNYDGELWC